MTAEITVSPKIVTVNSSQNSSLNIRGISLRDIHAQFQNLYRIELSTEMVCKITGRILPEVKE